MLKIKTSIDWHIKNTQNFFYFLIALFECRFPPAVRCPLWSPGCFTATHLCSSASRWKLSWWTVACVRAPKQIIPFSNSIFRRVSLRNQISVFIWNKNSLCEFASVRKWQAAWSNGSATVTALRWNKRHCTGALLGRACNMFLLNLFWTRTRKSTFIMLLWKVNIKLGHSWYGWYSISLQKKEKSTQKTNLCLVFMRWGLLSVR